jgi:hypothetical protein
MKGKKKDPPKSKRGEQKLRRAVEQRREKLREAAPDIYSNLADAYQTPEGLPTLEEFAVQRDVDRAYGEAHPMQGATKMVDLGPLMFERWLGKKKSADGVNYRAPYYRAADITESTGSLVQEAQKAPFGSGLRYGGFRNEVLNKYKKEHKNLQKSKTGLDKLRGAVGSVFPPANFLLAGGASIGGRNIPEALAAPVGAAAFIPMYNMLKRKSNTGQQPSQGQVLGEGVMDAGLGALGTFGGGYGVFGKGIYQGGAGDAVVPTSGVGLNPFNRERRQIKKETREDVRKIKTADTKSMAGKTGSKDALIKREAADVDRLVRLYEKKHGVKVARKQPAPTTYQSFMSGGIMKVKKK